MIKLAVRVFGYALLTCEPRTIFWCAAGMFACLAAMPPVVLAADGGVAHNGSASGQIRLQQAIQVVAKEAYPAFSENAAFSAAIKGYLRAIDAYSTYISPEDAKELQTASSPEFDGVGMDVIQDHRGFLYCLPYAGSPAEQAGITYGDSLRSINGIQAEAMSLQSVMARIRGPEGTTVTLGIVGADGLQEYTLTRKRVVLPAVELSQNDTIPRIRIMRFDGRTKGELLAALASIVSGSPLILDLRGNVGGDLSVAVDCAGLFLQEGTAIVTMRKKKETPATLRAKAGNKAHAGGIVLWQDRFTASAAEVFCAALSQNKRGQTLGQRSFGKGVTQRIIPANDGGLYIITNAELLPPNGSAYDCRGLEPDVPVMPASVSIEQDFLRQTHVLLGTNQYSE